MRVECTCRQCGAVFAVVPAQVKRGRAKFCSKDCANAARRVHVAVVCDQCGASVSLKSSKANRGVTAYCSRDCYMAARADGAWITAPCKTCGAPMTYRRSQPKRFCSWGCRDQGADWGDPSKRTTVTCAGCGTVMIEWASRPRTYCSTACAGDARAGDAAWAWRGGRPGSYGASWRRARRLARARDGRCVDCGITPDALRRALDVHHLIPFRSFGIERHREANVLTNLVSLCQRCHLKREWATNWRERAQ